MKKVFLLSLLAISMWTCSKSIETPTPNTASAAPEISLTDSNGKALNLSSLKGKVVILQFWASWCPGCRKENPVLVKLYDKYKDKGLEVYSVSLDTDKTQWQKAIKDDGLTWPNHVSDLLKWKSPVTTTYNVQFTPYKVLIDRKGNIQVNNFTSDMEAEVLKLL